MALNVACFGAMPATTPPPLGKNWGFVWAEGRDEGGGGIEVELVVDLASGPRSRLGKREKEEGKKTQPGSPA